MNWNNRLFGIAMIGLSFSVCPAIATDTPDKQTTIHQSREKTTVLEVSNGGGKENDKTIAPSSSLSEQKPTFEVLNGTGCFKNFRNLLKPNENNSKSTELVPPALNSSASKSEPEILNGSDVTKSR